jgi:hypothetical protein
MRLKSGEAIRIIQRVDLVCRGDDRLVDESLARRVASREQLELARDDIEVGHGIAAAYRGHVDKVNEHLRTFQMAQEPVTESGARMRTFDQTGHIRDDE